MERLFNSISAGDFFFISVEEEWLVPVEETLLGVLESTIPPEYRSFSQWVTLDGQSSAQIVSTATRATSSIEMTSHHLISAPPLVICTCELIPENNSNVARSPCPHLKVQPEKSSEISADEVQSLSEEPTQSGSKESAND